MKKILIILMTFIISFSLLSCGEIEESETKAPITITNDTNDKAVDLEFSVTLMFNSKVIKPVGDVLAVWYNEFNQYSSEVVDGVAKVIGPDGEYNVYLDGEIKDSRREVYTYNPNIYKVDNDNRDIVIELLLLSKTSGGSGSEYDSYLCQNLGTYRSELIKSDSKKIFYMFKPTVAGTYSIETLVNIFADQYNPIVEIYTGTQAYKKLQSTQDTGGSTRNGFTKNVKWSVSVSSGMIGNVYTFAIKSISKLNEYPTTVDFSITWQTDYKNPYENIIVKKIEPKECDFKTPDFSNIEYKLYNADGTIGRHINGTAFLNGTLPESTKLVGANFAYNPDYQIEGSDVKGVWFHYDPSTKTYLEPLMAYIESNKAPFYPDSDPPIDESPLIIADNISGALTVSNGTENYRYFIEEYIEACNKDGMCYVTNELKEFLQKFAVSQVYFADGNGWCETMKPRVYAGEDDQWLFGCGYYKEIV